MGRKKHGKFVDDGRSITDMNVDGMPWYNPESGPNAQTGSDPIELTAAEKRAVTWGVLKASLLVTFIFIGGFALFILFCVNVWFA